MKKQVQPFVMKKDLIPLSKCYTMCFKATLICSGFELNFMVAVDFAVMHFADPGGGGVPAGCMAFPSYVGPPDGMGNSEMTWLPLLAGAARTLGVNGSLDEAYGSLYATMDDAYRAQTFGHTSFLQPASRC